MLRKRRSVIAIILILICLSGCGNGDPIAAFHDELLHITKPDHDRALESVGVYLDTTPSMKGFLTQPDGFNGTVYSRCLHELGKLVAGKYNEDQVMYYRMDTPLWKVEKSENIFEKARNESYYIQSEYLDGNYTKVGVGEEYNSLCITTALEEGRKQDLCIFVTDFYENTVEDNTNVATLIAKIRELAYLDDGKVFGLIGLKSTYAGKIYDTGTNGSPVEYGIEDGSMAYRPFYIILRGYPEHVQAFCNYMEKHLDALELRSREDYKASVFYTESFFGLDYTALINCVNRDSHSLIRANLSSSVTVQDSGENIGLMEMPIYYYYIKDISGYSSEDRTLYFSYAVDDMHRSEFLTIAQKYGRKVTVNFLIEAEKELYVIPCISQELTVARWDENGEFNSSDSDTGYNGKDFYEIDAVYYDPNTENVYVALHLAEQKFTEGLWRLQWKNTLDKPESLTPWWEDWHSVSGTWVDYSRTERLAEYVEPIFEKMLLTENCILNGVLYLNIKEG